MINMVSRKKTVGYYGYFWSESGYTVSNRFCVYLAQWTVFQTPETAEIADPNLRLTIFPQASRMNLITVRLKQAERSDFPVRPAIQALDCADVNFTACGLQKRINFVGVQAVFFRQIANQLPPKTSQTRIGRQLKIAFAVNQRAAYEQRFVSFKKSQAFVFVSPDFRPSVRRQHKPHAARRVFRKNRHTQIL